MSPLSYNSIVGGSSNASNDFTINVGTSGYTNISLSTSFPAGSYICTSSLSDTSLDIYLINEDGTSSGYANATTATTSITALKSFNKVVVYGGTNNDTLEFQFKYVFSPSNVTDNILGAAPRLISLSTSAMPNSGDTTTVTGQNFATDITATFIGSDSVNRSGSVSRTSATSLVVTRPATMPELYSPYSLVLQNPGIANPTSTNSHRINNYITTKPSAPTIGAITVTGGTSVTVAFTAPSNTGGVAITGYEIVSSPSIALTYSSSTTSSPISVTGNFAVDTAYTFTIAAINSNGTGAASTASSSVTPNASYVLSQTFNTSGTYTVPAGKTQIAAFVVGAGGGGGGGGGMLSSGGGSGGGSGAGLAFKDYPVTPGQNFSVVIGSAGNAGPSRQGGSGNGFFPNLGDSVGGSGGSSSFGNIVTVNGGNGGIGNSGSPNPGGSGGTVSSNINSYHSSLVNGVSGGNQNYRSWGTNTPGSGNAGSTASALSMNLTGLGSVDFSTFGSGGAGGSGGGNNTNTMWNGSPGSAGGTNAGSGGSGGNTHNPNAGNAGGAASSYGSGGGGGGQGGYHGINGNGGASAAGGAGFAGRVIVYVR